MSGKMIMLWCWVKNDEFDEQLLQVHMTSSATISMLKQENMPLLSESIGVTHMKLWQVGILYWFGAKV